MKVYITAPLAHNYTPENREERIKLVNFVDSILKEFKFSTYVTYRDFLQWGKVSYNPTTVFEKIYREVKASDLVVGVYPNEGVGSSILLGMASAFKKHMIIILDKNFDIDSLPGLMYKGFNNVTKCQLVINESTDDLRTKFRKAILIFLKLYKK